MAYLGRYPAPAPRWSILCTVVDLYTCVTVVRVTRTRRAYLPNRQPRYAGQGGEDGGTTRGQWRRNMDLGQGTGYRNYARLVAWAIRCQDAKLATQSIIGNMQRQKQSGLGRAGPALVRHMFQFAPAEHRKAQFLSPFRLPRTHSSKFNPEIQGKDRTSFKTSPDSWWVGRWVRMRARAEELFIESLGAAPAEPIGLVHDG